MDPKTLIHQYVLGNLDEDAVKELDLLLGEDAELRRDFRLATHVDAALRESSIEHSIDEAQGHSAKRAREKWTTTNVSLVAAFSAIAATLLVVVGSLSSNPKSIATLVSSENAAWESLLPTNPGAGLSAGTLNLKTGLAMIRFGSGAELTLEAPAEIELISAMRARLGSGAALMNVPESAKGFKLETPESTAIDFGTRFAVQVDHRSREATFQLIEGEIEIRHDASGKSIRLTESGTGASISAESMQLVEASEEEGEAFIADESVVRISSHGRCGTAMPRSHKRAKFIDPELLMVKKSNTGNWDYRSFFEFDLAGIDLDAIQSARIRLNLVPSGRGVASRLPKVNRFAVYGLTNRTKARWKVESTWEEAPDPDDGMLLGRFEVLRSEKRGTFGIATSELLKFVRQRGTEPITFIVVRETKKIDGVGVGLAHAFASDKHPESVGPLLELRVE